MLAQDRQEEQTTVVVTLHTPHSDAHGQNFDIMPHDACIHDLDLLQVRIDDRPARLDRIFRA